MQQVLRLVQSAVVKGRKPLAMGLAGLVLGVDVPHHPQQPMAVAALQGLTVLLLAGIGVRLVGGGRLVEHCQQFLFGGQRAHAVQQHLAGAGDADGHALVVDRL